MAKKLMVISILITLVIVISNLCSGMPCCNQMAKCPMEKCARENVTLYATQTDQTIKIKAPTIHPESHPEINPFISGLMLKCNVKNITAIETFVLSTPKIFLKDLVLLI